MLSCQMQSFGVIKSSLKVNYNLIDYMDFMLFRKLNA